MRLPSKSTDSTALVVTKKKSVQETREKMLCLLKARSSFKGLLGGRNKSKVEDDVLCVVLKGFRKVKWGLPTYLREEEREETVVKQSSKNLHGRSIFKRPAKFDNFVLLAEHTELESNKEAIASEDSDKWLVAMKNPLTTLRYL
ncbi:hypothetical protein TNIN_449551 [Trichonephila inaurata madagascariensis]|uniref:Uncharacterized protein n=1 Tax=Trichonephila inaurata madagascariensis TaxID=2747483 RepID=A0A8X6M6F9_9ARAC|nr:hypothetical protein TNIN_449551 [Trichonephila inaurata madagascariensis]